MTWAFGLPLKPAPKLVLLGIADVVNDDGIGYVSIEQLETKSSTSRSTVQRKVKRMEEMGLLARFQKFASDGRRLKDEFRLVLGVKAADLLQLSRDFPDLIHGTDDDESEQGETDIADEAGSQNDTPPGVSDCDGEGVTQVTRGGCQQVTPLEESNLNQREDSPPNPPPGGDGSGEQVLAEAEPEHFATFFENCNGWRTVGGAGRAKALEVFALLEPHEQERAAAASPVHAAECVKFKRKSLDPYKLLRSQFWVSYPHAKLPEKPPPTMWVSEGSDAHRVVTVLDRILNRSTSRVKRDEERGFGFVFFELPADAMALTAVMDEQIETWPIVEQDSREFGAWAERIGKWLHAKQRIAPLEFTVGHTEREWNGSTLSFPIRKHGLRVPRAFPPRKDGAWPEANAPPPVVPEMTDDDDRVQGSERVQ